MSNAVGTLYQLFAILQKYEFSSKSQPLSELIKTKASCLRYCKSTSFQANHNCAHSVTYQPRVVCDTAKVRVFKQITTRPFLWTTPHQLFAILQKYEFSSKSQLRSLFSSKKPVVCDTAKVRVFKQITTFLLALISHVELFAILQKYEFSSKSQLLANARH